LYLAARVMGVFPCARHLGDDRGMTPAAIHHVALRVADPDASLAFYGGVLGLAEVRRWEEEGRVRSIWVRCGDAVLMLERAIRPTGPASGSGHVLVLEVASLAEWEGRLAGAGVPVDDRTEKTLYVFDPDGHRVGLTVFPRESWLQPQAASEGSARASGRG
jgi:catechol 2,3-dioxygenase-like lactoylglutathione lyase family enzyme